MRDLSPDQQKIWKDTYNFALGPVWMEEETCVWLLNFWSRVNVTAAILVAVTVPTSTIAGLSLWENPRFKFYWATVAILASVVSILTTAFDVPNRVKNQGEYRTKFKTLRLTIQAFLMDLESLQPAAAREQFKRLRDESNALIANSPADFTLTESRRLKIQAKLVIILSARGYTNDRSPQSSYLDPAAPEASS